MLHSPELVTASSAPRIDVLCSYPELFEELVKLFPNAKLPPKHHAEAVAMASREDGPYFPTSQPVSTQAEVWAGHIRTALTKYRDLVMYPKKMSLIEKQAAICVTHVKSYAVGDVYIHTRTLTQSFVTLFIK